MNKEELEKLARLEPAEPKVIIKFPRSYDGELVVSHSAAVKIIDALKKAELLKCTYTNSNYSKTINPYTKLSFEFLTDEEYTNIKMAELLGIKSYEIKQQQKDAPF